MSSVVRAKQTVAFALSENVQSVARFGEPLMPLGFSLDAKSSALRSIPATFELTREEIQSFLRLIARSLQIKRHYELFQLVQGEVQDFIPHRILVSAWGDFDGSELNIDVISAMPGVRTNRPATCDVGNLMRHLYLSWLAHGRQPLLLHNALGNLLGESNCRCALHESLHGMGAALIHGVQNVRDGTDSLYLAQNVGPIIRNGVGVERFQFLADLIILQLDTAFRRVAALKRQLQAKPGTAQRRGRLSLREQEIIDWVAKGRTNAEISGILSISEYTVKNHMRRIMKKLGAANRTEAVAKFRLDVRDPRMRIRGEGARVTTARA